MYYHVLTETNKQCFIFSVINFLIMSGNKDKKKDKERDRDGSSSRSRSSSSKPPKSSTRENLLLAAKMLEVPSDSLVGAGLKTPPNVVPGISPVSVPARSEAVPPVVKAPVATVTRAQVVAEDSVEKVLLAMKNQQQQFQAQQQQQFQAQQQQLASFMGFLQSISSNKDVEGSRAKEHEKPQDPQLPKEIVAPANVPEEEVAHHVQDEGEEDAAEGGSLLEQFSLGKNMFIPDETQVELWACAAKLSPEYGNAWTNLKVSNLVTKWTGHPLNSTFKASGIDPGLLPLKYKDLQAQEKQTVFLQNCAGAIAAIGTRMLGLIQGKPSSISACILSFIP